MDQLITVAVMAFALGLCIGGASMYWLIMFIARAERAYMHALATKKAGQVAPTG